MQAALASSFSSLDIPAPPPKAPAASSQQPTNPASSSKPAPKTAEALAEAAAARDESWKSNLDQHTHQWREEAAVRRAAAERERARWEDIRKKEGERVVEPTSGSQSQLRAGSMPTTSVADARDLVTGEHVGGYGAEALNVRRLAYFAPFGNMGSLMACRVP